MPITTIDSSNAHDFLEHVQKSGFSRGLLKRNFSTHPEGYHAAVPPYPDELLLTDDEIMKRLKQQQKDKGSMYDLRMANYDVLKSLDQNGFGLCWAFSSTKGNMYARVAAGLPPLRLSAYYVAGKVKGWRDQGGWCQQSAGFIAQNGEPLESLCPEYKHKYDTPECEADAEFHQMGVWYDGSDNREKNRRIMLSAYALGGIPICDYNFLGHSMCGCRALDLNTVDCDNSWQATDKWGEKGLYRLSGSHAIPDNCCVVFSSEMTEK